MIGSGSFATALRGAGGHTFDVPVAALAGLSVAFVAFAAPADLLAELVGASGLPAWLPAAEPPLGFKARLAIGAAGALAVFALTFLLLRWLDRRGRQARERAPEPLGEVEMPRLRRRDLHPDAPPRPPILARELGDPAPVRPRSERPSWLPEEPAEPEQPAEPEMPAEKPDVAGPEPEVPAAKPFAAGAEPGSIAQLMERLERGLAQRRVRAVPPAPAPAPAPSPGVADDRLQSAIDSLQRLAARQS